MEILSERHYNTSKRKFPEWLPVLCVLCSSKDGNEVRIGSIDGEADYYPLSTAWMVSSIFGKFFKLNVELYANTDDADADLNDFLSQLIKYSR